MEKEQNHNGTALEKADNREYVYVRYECNDDDEMDIYDIIDLCKKGVLKGRVNFKALYRSTADFRSGWQCARLPESKT